MPSTATPSYLHLPPLAPSYKSACVPVYPLRQPEKVHYHYGANETTPQSGLRTPPAESMGTTYQVPSLGSCGDHHAHHHAPYVSALASSDRQRKAFSDAVYEPTPTHSMPNYQQQVSTQPRATQPPPSSVLPSNSRHSTTPSTPLSGPMAAADEATASRDATMVLHSLRIPACISPKGGNLADFAAQITCLFWFESTKTLQAAENIRKPGATPVVQRLTENAIPTPNFKKWVQTVLSTTQVTQNVVLLALLFIYRLKVANPNVKGRPGSEYRLLTVALMLGNKFLDDNTYTNKTWAEVSGISVGEIHVMEVEFLSNMRYSLLVSKDQWEEWLVKLAKFWEYCDWAERPPVSPLAIPSPTNRSNFVSPLPSPTGIHHQPALSLQPAQQHIPGNLHRTNTACSAASQARQAAYQAGNMVSPLALKPELHNLRKRGLVDEDPTEPPAKRLSRLSSQPQSQLYHQRDTSTAFPDSARLSVPNLTINTGSTPALLSNLAHPGTASYVPPQPTPLSLPPLVPGVRAMSTVYPPTAPGVMGTQLLHSTPDGSHVTTSMAPTISPTSTYPATAYGTPTKRLSPHSSMTPATAGYGSSPLTESFPHPALTPLGGLGTASGVHTPISHSPSIYLQQRPSPYKPVRHVNTLLYPPPSAFLHEYHLSTAVPPTQMHYQPLGRRNEYRTGIVPEFAAASTGGYATGRQVAPTPVSLHPAQQVPQGQPNHTRSQPAQNQFTLTNGRGGQPTPGY